MENSASSRMHKLDTHLNQSLRRGRGFLKSIQIAALIFFVDSQDGSHMFVVKSLPDARLPASTMPHPLISFDVPHKPRPLLIRGYTWCAQWFAIRQTESSWFTHDKVSKIQIVYVGISCPKKSIVVQPFALMHPKSMRPCAVKYTRLTTALKEH